MSFNDVPENPTPTPPPNERPIPTGPLPGAPRGAQPYSAAPQGTEDPYGGVIDEVHRIWSAALDDPAPQADTAPPDQMPTPFHDDLRKSTSVPQWSTVASEVGSRYGVPKDVALAVIDTTSGGDPGAKLAGGQAAGLAGVPLHQFGAGEDPHDPATNLDKALSKLSQLHAQTGDWTKAATRLFGASDAAGNPRVLGPGADGFQYAEDFQRARRRYGGE